jgi:hypothetical protein
MKQLIFLLALLISSANLLAQRNFSASKTEPAPSLPTAAKVLSAFDTLGLANFNASPKVLYLDQLGNYVVGSNFFGDLAKAQEFNITSRKNVGKVLFYFAAKKKVAPDSLSYLLVNIYALDGNGFASTTTKACPGTILHSRKLLLDSIDTIAGNFTTVNFDWAPTDDSIRDFAVGFDMTHLDTADRVGLYATKDSSANKSQRSWEKQIDGKWYTMLRSWPLDIDFAIFPIVDTLFVGVKKQHLHEVSNFSLFPNPATDKIKLSFVPNEAGPMRICIHDTKGTLVYSTQFNNYRPGVFEHEIITTNFAAGVYSCSILTNTSLLSKKLILVRF